MYMTFDTFLPVPEDSFQEMNLIEILWKQDIDLGVSREAYDSRPGVEVEKIKDDECRNENLKDFEVPNGKPSEENVIDPDIVPYNAYTVDSETGEFVLDELSELSGNELSGIEFHENDTFSPINCDSYLPVPEDGGHNPLNMSDLFPFLSNISSEVGEDPLFASFFRSENMAKQLLGCLVGNSNDSSLYNQPEDAYPNFDDNWPDSTSIAPLLAVGNANQNQPVSAAPWQEQPVYQNPTPMFSFSSNMPMRSNDAFTGILQNSSISSTNEFHPVPTPEVSTSVGYALAESIETLHNDNDTDPVPVGSHLTSAYNPDISEFLFSNQSLAARHNELLIQDLFQDNFSLPMPPEANQRIPFAVDHAETSSDSISIVSGRVPSTSDCLDWGDTCSEASSHHGENRSPFMPLSGRRTTIIPSTELYHSGNVPKRQGQLENPRFGSTDFREHFDQSTGNEASCFRIKSEYPSACENSAEVSNQQFPTCSKFDYATATSSGAACGSIHEHNHSYAVPFSSSKPHSKPFARDKSRSSSSDEDSNNKDEKRARELQLPISIEDIINLTIEEYNERLSKYELTEQQLSLIRDIRRRGKNKVAAQNCRKRKMDQISGLQQDLDQLQLERMQLQSKQNSLLQEKHSVQEKYVQLYNIISQHTNSKPPSPSHSISDPMGSPHRIPSPSDLVIDEECDPSRGARAKRKCKK